MVWDLEKLLGQRYAHTNKQTNEPFNEKRILKVAMKKIEWNNGSSIEVGKRNEIKKNEKKKNCDDN